MTLRFGECITAAPDSRLIKRKVLHSASCPGRPKHKTAGATRGSAITPAVKHAGAARCLKLSSPLQPAARSRQ